MNAHIYECNTNSNMHLSLQIKRGVSLNIYSALYFIIASYQKLRMA